MELTSAIANTPHTRRRFLDQGLRIGAVALTWLMNGNTAAYGAAAKLVNPLAPKQPPFRPRAKSIIQLFMTGGPSHLDMFDYKPTLERTAGQPLPKSVLKDVTFAQIRDGQPLVMPSLWGFGRHGESGQWVSDLLPHTAKVVDQLTFVRTVMTDEKVHPHAEFVMNTGHRIAGRPSLGAWLVYGLGSEAENLPGYVVINSNGPTRGKNGNYHNGFLPPVYQGVEFRNRGEPILNTLNPAGITSGDQRSVIDAINRLNMMRLELTGDSEIAARISAYELAFQLQSSAPELIDLSDESPATFQLYGCDAQQPSFARDCLLARRMVERGVRFVQVHFGDWDHHTDIALSHPNQCRGIDQACAALIQDLKQRGLLDETLVIWGGEFGRTPVAQPKKSAGGEGRDHHINAFTMWMAGGGLKPGSIGQTDEFGFNPVEDPISIHDLHATILHLLGLEHTRLTYRYQGRDFRLTDVYGNVIEKMLA
ncbi:MAG: DUF1501 domain-containing protein [Pirellulales bacterium]